MDALAEIIAAKTPVFGHVAGELALVVVDETIVRRHGADAVQDAADEYARLVGFAGAEVSVNLQLV